MRKKLLLVFVFWYRKWVVGECRHICRVCPYRKQCTNDTWWADVNNITYYKKERNK